MEKLSICRICLVENVRMYVVTNKSLQQMYEKLTDISFVTEDSRPMLACFFCCTKLKQCCLLQRKCLEAEELLAQMLSEDYEQRPLKNQEHLEFAGGFIISPIENINIVEECQAECNAIKQELADFCEQQYNVELKVENHSEELDPEHVEISHPDVEDTPALHSTSESGDEEIEIIKIETEDGQELSEQEHRVSETERAGVTKKAKLNSRKRKLEHAIPAEQTMNELSNSTVTRTTKTLPDVGSEVELTAVPSTSKPRRRSIISTNAPNFDEAVTDWLTLGSESDTDMDDDNDELSQLPRQVDHITDCDLTPQQIQILQAEDSANDTALQNLLPEDSFTFDWTRDRTTFKSRRETFVGIPGPTFDLNEDTRPIDIFDKMFDVDFIDLLCIETNRYAQQKIRLLTYSNKIGAKSRLHSWTPTDRPEMISFLALMIIQGLYPLPVEESYFTFNGFGTMPYISKIMTYNRYILLKSMFHFVDNDTLTDLGTTSKLGKIAPIIDYFNDKFSSLYYPHQDIAIDESLLKWHGRLSFAQKISTKAAQVGVKTYELCDSSSGYLWRFSVCTGKSMTTTTNDDIDDNNEDENNDNRPHQTERTTDTDYRPTNATAKIVLDLIEPLLHRGHTAIMDNFYNCPLLARCLKRRQTDCYGTQRLNREFVPSSVRTMTKSDLRHGEIVATYCSDLSLMVWRDSNLVSMISTYHPLQVGTREKYNRTAYKPSVVLDYNKSMGGIDRKDQYLSAHPIERVRSRVWYKNLFRRFFNCAVFNCFVIFSTKHKLRHRQFRTVLAESLLKTYRQIDLTTETRLISRTYGQTTTTVLQRYCSLKIQNRPIVETDHFPVHASAKRGRCWWCAHTRQVTSRTIWKCKECDVNLCILGCFRDYHKP